MRAKKKAEAEERGQPRPTIWDVAKLSGVSISTVSRVLNGQTYVAAETRDKVFNAVQELGYVGHRQPQGQAQSSEQLQLVGLTSVSMEGGPYTEIVGGLIEALHARNARPIICPLPRRHNCNMPLLERLMSNSTAGALLLGSTETDESLQEAIESGFPFVIIYPDRPLSRDIPVVTSAEWSGARAATEYLIELGHKRIGFIKITYSRYASQQRFEGFQSALLAAGLSVIPELIYEGEPDSKAGGYEAGKYFLSLPEPPTAIVAFSDSVGAGIIKAAQEHGVVVPRDLSVIGFDGLEAADIVTPELTTIRLPFQEMGRVGADMLLRLIDGLSLDATRVELTARLIVKASTAPAPNR